MDLGTDGKDFPVSVFATRAAAMRGCPRTGTARPRLGRDDVSGRLVNRDRYCAPAARARQVAAALLLGFAALLALPFQAQAQTETTFVSNLNQASENSATSIQDRAQTFTTGTHAAGYTLSSVVIGYNDTGGTSFSAEIWTTFSNGRPDTLLYSLTAPDNFTQNDLTFTAPENSTLDPETTYTVVMDVTGTSVTFKRTATDNDDEDSGAAAGWSIGNAYHFYGTSWAPTTSSKSHLIAVKGTLNTAVQSTDATLSALELKDGSSNISLAPPFGSSVTDYTANVANGVDEITILPTKGSNNAALVYQDGNGMTLTDADSVEANFQASLGVGANTIKLKLTSEDMNSTETYTVTVTRAALAPLMQDPVLVGNKTVSSFSNQDRDEVIAQRFNTGSNSLGYTLSTVEIAYRDAAGDTFSAKVCTATAADAPTSACTELIPTEPFASGDLTFVVAGGMQLAASTKYTVVLTPAPGATVSYQATGADGQDSGSLAGWNIAGEFRYQSGSNWPADTGSRVLVMQLRGNPNGSSTPATGKPSISGPPQVGKTLMAGTADIDDDDGLTGVSYSYQWLRAGVNISGATSSSYTLTSSDQNQKISVRVSFTDDAGNPETLTSDPAYEVAPAAALSNCGADTVWCGLLTVGQELDEDDYVGETGFEARSGQIAYGSVFPLTFMHLGVNYTVTTLHGADTQNLYFSTMPNLPADGAGLTLHVQAYGGELDAPLDEGVFQSGQSWWFFQGKVNTTPTTPLSDVPLIRGPFFRDGRIGEPPEPGTQVAVRLSHANRAAEGKPGISGTAQVGQTLTAEKGAITDADGTARADASDAGYAYTYQWVRVDGVNETGIAGATSKTYLLTTADQGRKVKVKVSFTDDGDSAEGPLTSDAWPAGTGTIEANVAPGVTVSKPALTVTEQDTAGDTYTLVLDSEPTANVTLMVGGASGTEVSASPSSLSFTPSNWDTEQTVTVTAGDDSDQANDSVTLTHTAASTDANYNGISINSVVVTVDDNDDANAAPVFSGGTEQERTLAETVGDAAVAAAADIGAAVAATDANNDTLSYSLAGADAARFTFDTASGQLKTRAGERYDYETDASYSVTVTADDGTVDVTAAVTINIGNNTSETPLAPAAPAVTAAAGSMTSLDVNWSAPNNTGRPALTGYDLRYRAQGTTNWSNGPQNVSGASAAITGLTAGTAYDVQVRGRNADGVGEWSPSGTGPTGAASGTPVLSFGSSSYTAVEGLAGAVVTVRLTLPAPAAVTIALTTAAQGGATAADYTGVPASVSFAAGDTARTFTVTAVNDSVDDAGESLLLGFGPLPAGVSAGAPATTTVALAQDAGVSAWFVSWGQPSYNATEGGAGARVTVRLNAPWKPERNEALTVPLFTPGLSGGATAADFSGVPESVTFQPGQTQVSFTVTAADDSEDDDGESVFLQFRDLFPDGLDVGRGPGITTVHLRDNDGLRPVVVSFDALSYTAQEGGAAVTVGVRLDSAPGRQVVIPLTTANDGASPGDYSGVPASITFGATDTARSFAVTATDDSFDDDLESVTLGFGALPPRVSAGGPAEAVLNLTDNDGGQDMLTLNLDVRNSPSYVRRVREGGSYRMHMSLDRKPGVAVTIPLLVEYTGGATAADVSGVPANVTFEARSRNVSLSIRPVDDTEVDPGEGFVVKFGTLPAGVQVGEWSGPSAVFSIEDNDGPPGLSVSDWRSTELAADGSVSYLRFEVTLDRAAEHEVRVDYATADGTAVAGQDYIAESGTLVFEDGERSKFVWVEVIDDSHDEGIETMRLRLSNPVRAYLADGVGIGTIRNSDMMPGAWLTRFGRTTSDHVIEAVGERWRGGPQASHLSIGGRQAGDLFGWPKLGGQTERATAKDPNNQDGTDTSPAPLFAPSGGAGGSVNGTAPGMTMNGAAPGMGVYGTAPAMTLNASGMNMMPDGVDHGAGATLGGQAAKSALLGALGLPGTGALTDLRSVLMGSSFFYARPRGENGEDGPPGRLGEWSAWGRTAASQFSGAEDKLTLDGETATAMLGVDSHWGRWFAGVALSYSEGEGVYRGAKATGGEVESTLTSLNPYARYQFSEHTSFWGVLGYGAGGLSLTPELSETALETDLSNAMAAFGGRTSLNVRTGEAGRFELALRSDARLTNTTSGAIEGLAGAEGATGRVRLVLEGSGSLLLATGGMLTPSLEAGLRYDSGDAETGAGLELGGGLGYTAGRLGVEVTGRALLAHEDTEYQEWGFSGSVQYQPGRDGRGLSLKLGSAWGVTGSGVQSLWTRQDATGLAGNAAFEAEQRYQVELRYGLEGLEGRALWAPYIGVESGQGGNQALRLGVKLRSGGHLDAGFEIGRQTLGPDAYQDALQLGGALRW